MNNKTRCMIYLCLILEYLLNVCDIFLFFPMTVFTSLTRMFNQILTKHYFSSDSM